MRDLLLSSMNTAHSSNPLGRKPTIIEIGVYEKLIALDEGRFLHLRSIARLGIKVDSERSKNLLMQISAVFMVVGSIYLSCRFLLIRPTLVCSVTTIFASSNC